MTRRGADRSSSAATEPSLGGSAERPALFFPDAASFRGWLEANHATSTGVWVGFYKKHVSQPGLRYEQAVQQALCFGWIDSQVQRIDADAVRQRWTPRKSGSIWSNVNVEAVARLTEQGLMRPAGLAAFEARRPERTGIYTHEVDPGEQLPPEYDAVLQADPTAAAFFAGAPPSYRRLCCHWVASAKQEPTRRRRLAQLVEDCAHGRLIPSQRYGEPPAWPARLRAELGLGD